MSGRCVYIYTRGTSDFAGERASRVRRDKELYEGEGKERPRDIRKVEREEREKKSR